ncbi:hypothetical protein MmiHf6_04930 [Methanimicrococcus hongohii]|uniref:Uncharacterized protein n=1 Tax=Methanimicrococcus hongohii TaxID=3028295 RepID=A0AA96UZX0_9EURY|nr:hypothetical protein [Methanimicrococcus sp. Hf6]WNY23188.1 hypothetical protein MmiHf6_04930 [Methanimicrococcus sp. Hf6]
MGFKKSAGAVVLLVFVITVLFGGCLSNSQDEFFVSEMKTFQSENEMKSYLEKFINSDTGQAQFNSQYYNLYYGVNADWAADPPLTARSLYFNDGRLPQRFLVSDLQTKADNESDIVRISGDTIYYTPDNIYVYNQSRFPTILMKPNLFMI